MVRVIWMLLVRPLPNPRGTSWRRWPVLSLYDLCTAKMVDKTHYLVGSFTDARFSPDGKSLVVNQQRYRIADFGLILPTLTTPSPDSTPTDCPLAQEPSEPTPGVGYVVSKPQASKIRSCVGWGGASQAYLVSGRTMDGVVTI